MLLGSVQTAFTCSLESKVMNVVAPVQNQPVGACWACSVLDLNELPALRMAPWGIRIQIFGFFSI